MKNDKLNMMILTFGMVAIIGVFVFSIVYIKTNPTPPKPSKSIENISVKSHYKMPDLFPITVRR